METNILMLPEDYKEVAKRERYREREELRKQRIFDSKQRQIGIDSDALHNQIQEKKAQKEKDEVEKKLFDLQAQRNLEEANYRDHFAEMEKRRIRKEIDLFRDVYQQKEYGRDYDLEKPIDQLNFPHVNGDDTRYGVTVFEGEDVNLNLRQQHQKQQLKQWLYQQMVERKVRMEEKQKADDRFGRYIKQKDEEDQILAELENKCKRQEKRAIFEYNKALAQVKAFETQQLRNNEIQDNRAEIYNTLSSDFLLENAKLARSSLGPHRFNTMMYKGMSPQEIADIKKIQSEQIAEAKAKKEKEASEEKYWDRYSRHVSLIATDIERLAEKEKRTNEGNLCFQNKLLGQEQKAHQLYMNKVIFSNEATTKFFDQFNRSTR